MGNCIHVLCHLPQEKITVVIFNGGVEEFKASTRVEEITSGFYSGYKLLHQANPYKPLPSTTMLEPGEVYHLVPDFARLNNKYLVRPKISSQEIETCKRLKVKIVLTREQLELLLNSSKKWHTPKWRPSLPVISEVRSF